MATFTLTRTVARPFDDTVADVRTALGEQGFGILTEIDLAATFKAKLDLDLPPQVILGACRPTLAQQAVAADAKQRLTAALASLSPSEAPQAGTR